VLFVNGHDHNRRLRKSAGRPKGGRWPRVPSEVVLRRAQFSSFNATDPNATLMPHWNNPAWQECSALVDDPGEDPTGGANHY
jgi:hypothetical protein